MNRAAWRVSSTRPDVDYPEPPLSGELAVDFPAGTRWGVCLSHDVDHLGLREHLVDGFLLRYAANLLRQNVVWRFRPHRAVDGLWGVALAAAGHDRWDVLEDLLAAERRAGVTSTWFVSVRQGLGIAYDLAAAGRAARRIREAGHEVGLHGQSPADADRLAREVAELSAAVGAPVTGLRMHYLRLTRDVLDGMQRSGLTYDSTVMQRSDIGRADQPLPGPRLVRRGVVEIPLHVMDSTVFSATGLGLNLAGARAYVRVLMDRAASEGKVLIVNLHPNFYSRQSPDIQAWYDALLSDATKRSDVFITDFQGLRRRIVQP